MNCLNVLMSTLSTKAYAQLQMSVVDIVFHRFICGAQFSAVYNNSLNYSLVLWTQTVNNSSIFTGGPGLGFGKV